MIPYSRAPYHSMDVKHDAELAALLERLFRETRVDVVVETGTWLGLGSTQIFADAFVASGQPPPSFWTIEANREHWRQACGNLARYPFMRPLLGCSVPRAAVAWFLAGDEAVQHPDRFPDVYVDEYGDLAGDYGREAVGDTVRDDLLAWLLGQVRTGEGLFISLDSAGGIGWMEFQIVEGLLRRRDYLLFLDDVEHIKHFRSYAFMLERPERFEVLLQKNGWVVARHRAVVLVPG